MTRYGVIKAIPVENIARMILEIVKMYPEEKELTEWLKSELTKEELQVIEQVARSGNYPLSLSGVTGYAVQGGERVKNEKRIAELKEIAEEMMQIAINRKVSCSQMELVMLYLENKVRHRAGEKEF